MTVLARGDRRTVHQYGEHAVLVEVGDTAEVLALTAALSDVPLTGAVEVVPGARTVLVDLAPGADLLRAARDLARRPGRPTAADPADELTITVRYDGPDLDDVGRGTGLGVAGVVAAHTARTWTVAFVGFVPGFGYLVPDGPWPEVPRRDRPRVRVPAGAVGLAGPYSGVYPRASPGGWALIGTTPQRLWDLGREPPARLAPGMRVRFVADG